MSDEKAWVRGWSSVFGEILFQRITASHLLNPLPPHLRCHWLHQRHWPQLAEAGAHVVMAVRNTKAAQELIQQWQNEWSGKGLPLNATELDLLSLDSVARFADAWNARLGPLHVLINNAGIFAMGEAQKYSEDGYEQHMQVNHLAPALLSVLLLPSLIRGSPSRIINVNSVMHSVGFVDPDDMNVVSGRRKYSSVVGYSSSKLAQMSLPYRRQRQRQHSASTLVRFVDAGSRVSTSAAASAAASASMKTIVVCFADAAAAADAAAYYITTAGFIGVSRRTRRSDAAFGRGVRRFLRQRIEQELTQNVDAAAAAGTCGNQTNSPIVCGSVSVCETNNNCLH
ncbi:hypothetical protein F2Q69_00057497 [Brassica cretica]|uniref:3-oxoacyl-[acyl-carrier-protein] reductase n=1 Tax=Brassica cretica TaxID=69181 RepID=A0A8S9MXU2_BRACR|nr:hypothetical protein F2Q69_00057497 [Brassica cretica]